MMQIGSAVNFPHHKGKLPDIMLSRFQKSKQFKQFGRGIPLAKQEHISPN